MSAPGKEEFIQNLTADTWCGYIWCRKLYGYQYEDPAFLQRVYDRLDELGRDKVKYIYALYVKTEIAHEMEQEREAGADMVRQINKDYERKCKENQWERKEKKQSREQNYAIISSMLGFS